MDYSTDVLACDNLAEPFIAHAARFPQRCAVVDGDASLSYAQLAHDVRTLASYLARTGVKPGDRVAYVLPNCIDLVTVFYATQYLGAAVVPINHRSVGVEMAFFLRATGATVVFAADSLYECVREAAATCGHDCVVIGQEAGDTTLRHILSRADLPEVPMLRDRRAIARIQFTGGSTGVPKGVTRTHRADLVNVYGTASSNYLYEDPTKIVLIQSPIDHHGGHAWLTQTLSLAGTAVLCRKFDPPRILDAVERHRVSYLMLLPPSTYVRMMDHPDIGKYDLSSLRLVQTSAGGMNPSTAIRMYATFPNAIVNYGWGQTESGLGTSLVLTREMLDTHDRRIRSAGVAMPCVEVRVIDAGEREVPPGQPGEGVVRSEAVMSGYYGQESATRAAFTRDGWLKTGDVLSMDEEGYIYLHSRIREIIKPGGENVFIAEVEEVIKSHPSVLDCMVYGIPDPCFGEAVAAAVELRAGQSLGLVALQDWVKSRLASFKKPARMTVLPTLGRDSAGKVNRQQIIADCEYIEQQLHNTKVR